MIVNADTDAPTVRVRTHVLPSAEAASVVSNFAWFFGLYVTSLFSLAAIGAVVRWMLASL